MHYEEMRFWLEVVLFLGNPLFTWWRTREKVTNTHISALDKRLGAVETDKKLATGRQLEIEKKLAAIVKDVTHHVNGESHQAIERRLAEMNGSLKKLEGTVEGRMEGIGSALDMIQQHLLNGGK